MVLISWMGEDEKDLESGKGEKEYGGGEEGRRRGARLEKVFFFSFLHLLNFFFEKVGSTETQDTRLTCVEDQPDNPLDVGLFTVTPSRKMEEALIDDKRSDDLKGVDQDDPLNLKKPYTVSSRQLEGEGMRVARGESAFLSKSEIMCVNAKVWLARHVLWYTLSCLNI